MRMIKIFRTLAHRATVNSLKKYCFENEFNKVVRHRLRQAGPTSNRAAPCIAKNLKIQALSVPSTRPRRSKINNY